MRGCRRHQPPDPDCPTCIGRYARRIARRILASNPRKLFAVAFDTSLSVEQFRSWRTAVKNLLDHQRRECRWWRDVSIRVWLGADGRLHGVASLDALSPEEFIDAFRRWPVSLKRIEATDVDGAIYAAIAAGLIASSGEQGGYRRVRFTVKPQISAAKFQPVPSVPRTQPVRVATEVEPMPVLI
jgi:hypothetical protein